MTENEVATLVVDAAYRVHTALGPGLLESVYVAVLAHEVQKRGLPVLRQVPVQVRYDGLLSLRLCVFAPLRAPSSFPPRDQGSGKGRRSRGPSPPARTVEGETPNAARTASLSAPSSAARRSRSPSR